MTCCKLRSSSGCYAGRCPIFRRPKALRRTNYPTNHPTNHGLTCDQPATATTVGRPPQDRETADQSAAAQSAAAQQTAAQQTAAQQTAAQETPERSVGKTYLPFVMRMLHPTTGAQMMTDARTLTRAGRLRIGITTMMTSGWSVPGRYQRGQNCRISSRQG
jgi:hypothetical protein